MVILNLKSLFSKHVSIATLLIMGGGEGRKTTVTLRTGYEIHLGFLLLAVTLQAIISGQLQLYWQGD